MLDNADTTLRGSVCILVPYLPHHVATYHRWMQRADLQQLTSSVPLTLSEEYANQVAWREDPDKLTFIVLDAAHKDKPMVGDVNVFRMRDDDSAEAEIDVMIAEESARRKGIGSEAVCLIMGYAMEVMGVKSFVSKVANDNRASLALFQRLGFEVVKIVEAFGEKHLVLDFAKQKDRRCVTVFNRCVRGSYRKEFGERAS